MKSSGILEQIARTVRSEYRGKEAGAGPLEGQRAGNRTPRRITRRLAKGFQLIGEVKKGSPSRGIFRTGFDPLRLAREYAAGGAGGISIVTEPRFFFGDPGWMPRVRREVNLPLLRKDFILYPRQVVESWQLGADLVLLIAALLGDEDLVRLTGMCRRLGMEVLVEVHDRGELERLAGLDLSPDLVGINNRDLRDFRVDLRRSLRLKEPFDLLFGRRNPPVYLISESGIRDGWDITKLKEAGFHGALVGESLITAGHPREVLCRWLP